MLLHNIKRCGCFLKPKFLYLDDKYFYLSICWPLNWGLHYYFVNWLTWNNSSNCPYNKKLSCLCLILKSYIEWSTTFKLTKGSQRLKKNDQLLNLIFCSFFHFLCSNFPDNKCHKQKLCVLFSACIKLVGHVLAHWDHIYQMENTAKQYLTLPDHKNQDSYFKKHADTINKQGNLTKSSASFTGLDETFKVL